MNAIGVTAEAQAEAARLQYEQTLRRDAGIVRLYEGLGGGWQQE